MALKEADAKETLEQVAMQEVSVSSEAANGMEEEGEKAAKRLRTMETDGVAEEDGGKDLKDGDEQPATEAAAGNEVEELIVPYTEEFSVILELSRDDPKHMMWLHITRFVSDLDELEEIPELSAAVRLVEAEQNLAGFARISKRVLRTMKNARLEWQSAAKSTREIIQKSQTMIRSMRCTTFQRRTRNCC